MTREELFQEAGEYECKLTALRLEYLRHIGHSTGQVEQAKAEERAEIISALHTTLYITSTTAPTYAGLMQAVDIIKARG